MLTVEINNGAAVLEIDYEDGMTVLDLKQKISDYKPNQHARFADIQMYDPSQNRHLSDGDEIVDDRYYFCTAWVLQVVDDDGNRIKSV